MVLEKEAPPEREVPEAALAVSEAEINEDLTHKPVTTEAKSISKESLRLDEEEHSKESERQSTSVPNTELKAEIEEFRSRIKHFPVFQG